MKFGVILPSYGEQAARLAVVDTTLAAESLGFDSVWTTDHVALPEADAERFGNLYESLTTLGFLAGSTQRIRLGVSALVLPQRHPVEVAKQVATLDVLSGGRMMLAVGVGWSAGEYAHLNASFQNRGKRMDEAVQVLRTLWRGGKIISYHGQYYNFERLVFSPPPLQPGGPPLWVAGDSPRALQRAVRLADGWHPNAMPPETLNERLTAVRPLLMRRPFTVAMRIRLAADAAPSAETLSGSPEQIIARLLAYQAAGLNYAVIQFQAASQPERERAMQTFARQVLPVFR